MYLNAHYVVTIGALVFIYLRRNDSFYFVRNMFMIAMAIALVGYIAVPDRAAAAAARSGASPTRSPQFTGVGRVDYGAGQRALQLLRRGAVDARRASR